MENQMFMLVNPTRTHTASAPLIGITGKAGSGKDTLGTVIKADFRSIEHHSFAGPLKRMICEMLECTREQLEDRDLKENSLGFIKQSPRELMLSLGTEWGRDTVDHDLWVKIQKRNWHELMAINEAEGGDPCGHFYTDVRFDNEAEWIREEGGVIIEVRRMGNSLQPDSAKEHRSEAGINPGLVDAIVKAPAGDIDGLQKMGLRAIM